MGMAGELADWQEQLPRAAANRVELSLVVVVQRLVGRLDARLGKDQRADVSAVDDSTLWPRTAGETNERRQKIHRRRRLIADGSGGDRAGLPEDRRNAKGALPRRIAAPMQRPV